MGNCKSEAEPEDLTGLERTASELARDLDRINREKALEATECELRLQTDDGDDPVASVRAYGLESASALLARQAERLGLPAAGLELEFSNEPVPAECVLQEAGIMEGATLRVLGVLAMRQKLRRTDADIQEAVRAWLDDPVSAEAEYGHITKWNVKAVTNMYKLFKDASSFDEDLSGWDVSNVTSMSFVFNNASSFNQDVSGWDVSNVIDMQCMFDGASSFNQDVSGWDVSNVIRMAAMFSYARSFNQDVSGWDVSNVTNMHFMFNNASSFNQDVGGWDVSSVTDMYCMFFGARSFNQDVSGWDVSSVTKMSSSMFNGARVQPPAWSF